MGSINSSKITMKKHLVLFILNFLGFVQLTVAQVFEITSAYCECDKLAAKQAPNGQWIEVEGLVHETWCGHYREGSSEPSNILIQTLPPEMQQLNTLIDLFNTPNTDSKMLVEQEAARKRIAEMKAIEDKKRLERIERNEKLKNEMKPIDFVPFQQSQAPETMEERERRNLIKKGLSVTWNEFEDGGYGSANIKESEETTDQTEEEKKFYDDMKKIESNKLGKLAAFIGRSIYGISKEVNSYMLDAGEAITNNDPYTMKELADIDGKKLVVNGVIDGTKVTAKAYVEKGISNAKDKLYSAAISHNIAIVKSSATSYLEKYKKDYPLTYEWFKY
jgi:hypothetical protein